LAIFLSLLHVRQWSLVLSRALTSRSFALELVWKTPCRIVAR
jgi:hypothetical protein